MATQSIEDLIVTCPDCTNGMRDGARCETCNGQGLVRRTPEPAGESSLENLKKDELVALADERGIDASGTKADIIERLEAPG